MARRRDSREHSFMMALRGKDRETGIAAFIRDPHRASRDDSILPIDSDRVTEIVAESSVHIFAPPNGSVRREFAQANITAAITDDDNITTAVDSDCTSDFSGAVYTGPRDFTLPGHSPDHE